MMTSTDRIIFPLDIPNLGECHQWCDRLQGRVGVMKVGLELFTSCGPEAVQKARSFNFKVFLDLKLHDIPNTVAGAARAAHNLGASFVSVHASGGFDMMKAAVEAAGETRVLAITALTSLSPGDLGDIYDEDDPEKLVLKLATIAYDAGARGFVCSPQEVAKLKGRFPDATFVIPGIRPAGSDVNDQKRIATPASAIQDGADYLVIGRPIRNAPDPAAAADAIAAEIRQAL